MRKLQDQVVKYKRSSIFWFIILAFILTVAMYYYNVLFDIIILSLFILSCYSVGLFFKVNIHARARILIQIVIGMGILGFLMHNILLIGVGNKTLYLTMLLLPLFLQYHKLHSSFKEIKASYEVIQSKVTFYIVLFCCAVIIIIGNSTISWADALVKYLPCVTYAAETGAWKTNIVESIIFADQFTMYCSLATIGVALGAKRFLIWIATVCMCLTLLMLIEIAQIIYKKTNIILLTVTFFTTPLFLRLGTDMYIDFTQVIFLIAAILCMADLKVGTVWDNLYVICLLCGCGIFSKLTASYIVLAVGGLVIIFFFIYVIRNKVSLHIILFKMFIAMICLLCGLVTPIVYGIYFMGSPVVPWLNGIFKCPYVAQGNFVDPFQNSVYGINFNTLKNIVFHTSANMEMGDGALGISLLGLILIPLGIALYRNGRYIFWCVFSLLIFKLATLFSYNLRYYIVILVFFVALVCVTLSVINEKLFAKSRLERRIIFALLIVIVVIPNAYFFYKYQFNPLAIKRTESIYQNETAALLKRYVPEDSWVYTNDLAFRGDWTGTLYSNTWYNDYFSRRVQEDNISYENLLQAFDYVVLAKGETIESEEFAQIVAKADEEDSMLERYVESENIIIYKVKDVTPTEIVIYSETEDMVINVNNSFVCTWYNLTPEDYRVLFSVRNENSESITICYQIAYISEDGTILSRENFFIPVEGESKKYIESPDIEGRHDAAYALFGFYTYGTTESVYLNELNVLGYKDRSYINNLIQEYYKRIPLKDRKEDKKY